MSYQAKRAEGFGRIDWVVTGPCSCVTKYPDESDWINDGCPECPRCEGYRSIVHFSDLSENVAKERAEQLTNGELKPFNPVRFLRAKWTLKNQ